MKRLQLPRRVRKSDLGEIKSLSPWGIGVVLLLSLMLGVPPGGVSGQEKPGTRRAPADCSCTTAAEKPAEPLPDYRYSAQDHRDPLEPLLKEVPPNVLRPKPRLPERPLGPLERFDIAALKLVAHR